MTVVSELKHLSLIQPPDYVVSQIQYEVMTGSVAYGVSGDMSDVDIYGFCVPYKEMVFPHLGGEIQGFGRTGERFNQYQQHHIFNPSNKRSYDLSIFSIIKFFQLCMDNNPNMIDSLFVPQRCVLYCSQMGEHVRANRREFLHAGSYYRFKGYAYSQKNKLKNKVILKIINFEEMHGMHHDKNITFKEVVEEIEGRKKNDRIHRPLALLNLGALMEYKVLLQQCKDGKENILGHVLEQSIANENKKIETIDRQEAIINGAEELLKNYKFEFDEGIDFSIPVVGTYNIFAAMT